MRRGEHNRRRRRVTGLPDDLAAALTLPLGSLCAQLAARLLTAGHDLRAGKACVRFYGLGQLPEDLRSIAASLPRAHDQRESVGNRRVKQLLEVAEEELARSLAMCPLQVRPSGTVPSVDAFFGGDMRPPGNRLQVLLQAWADVPHGDHQSASALRLFEAETGFRPPLDGEIHREQRRRLRRRARAILAVAIERRGQDARASRRHHPALELVAQLPLAATRLVVVTDSGPELGEVLRSRPARLDLDALELACAHARKLVWEGSPHANTVLGALRLAVMRAPQPVPASILTRVLSMSTITAREQDDPAGFVAGWEALRVTHVALVDGTGTQERQLVISRAMRAAQELAELYDRFGLSHRAMTALGNAYRLLQEHGDPEAEDEPFGWLQQLLFTEAIIQRGAARAGPSPGALRAAQTAAARAAHLVYRYDPLPRQRATSAEGVLIEALLDEAELRQAAGDGTAARATRAQARRLIARTEAAWRRFPADTLTARSFRLASLRSGCRLSLLEGDVNDYLGRRALLQSEVGDWMVSSDMEALDALENLAERRHVPRLNLAARGIRTESRIGQRAWAKGLHDTEPAPARG
jgi:hypothetical protein